MLTLLVWLSTIGCDAPARTGSLGLAAPRDATAGSVGARVTSPSSPESLGDAPLCEPSGAASVAAGVLLVDNERDDGWFTFAMRENGSLDVGSRAFAPWPAGSPEDIEAVLPTPAGVLLVGSMSRNKSCKRQPERQHLRWVGADGATLVADAKLDVAAWLASDAACLARLDDAALGAPLCRALVAAEAAASPAACETLNVEGAALIDGRVWLGLRAPAVDGQAALLRLAPDVATDGDVRFDAAALVALDGATVRELHVADGALWLLAGPSADAGAGAFGLYRAPLPSPGARLVAERVSDAPKHAEALWGTPGAWWVGIDGDRGQKGAPRCAQPGRQAALTPQR